MYRYKDFFMMDVLNVSGRKIGFVKDIMIDFHLGKVTGFQVSPSNLFVKSLTVDINNIVSFNKVMIVKECTKHCGLLFKNFRNMEVIDYRGNMVGMLEDIIFDDEFKIKAILISFGIVRKLFEGKKVALIREIIIGEENVLMIKRNENINFTSVAHNLIGVNYYE